MDQYVSDRTLVIVDVQVGFMNDSTFGLSRLIAEVQDRYKFIVALKFVNPEGSSFRRFLDWDRFSAGSVDVSFAFLPRPNVVVVEKNSYSGTRETLAAVTGFGWPDIFDVCGVDTEGCVLLTAVGLFELGKDVRVLSGLCASSGGLRMHLSGLDCLRRLIGADRVID